MKRAVVTGAAGFVGRHMVKRLIDDGWHVVQIDTAFNGGFAMDCRDWFKVDTSHFGIAAHCAAVVGGRAKIDGSPLEVAVDFELDAAFARWCLRTRPDHVVYFSSSAAYPVDLQVGGALPVALREDYLDLDDLQHPDAIYGLVKVVGETLMRHLERAGVRTHVFRPFSGYGEDQCEAEYPFPAIIGRAKRREDPFDIWGDGEQIRDWIHISDLINAVMAAIEKDVAGPLNLGSGIPTSFTQLATMVCEAAGYKPWLRYLGTAPQGVRYRVCDPSRMLEVYQPTVSLEEGIRRALALTATKSGAA